GTLAPADIARPVDLEEPWIGEIGDIGGVAHEADIAAARRARLDQRAERLLPIDRTGIARRRRFVIRAVEAQSRAVLGDERDALALEQRELLRAIDDLARLERYAARLGDDERCGLRGTRADEEGAEHGESDADKALR